MLERDWPHGASVYSDINFILLGIASSGSPATRSAPGRCRRASLPPPRRAPPPPSAAPGAAGVLHGEVHDENAFALGPPAGHAGLFGTFAAVLDFAAGLLDGTGFSPAGARRRSAPPVSPTRTCGWERGIAGWAGGDRPCRRTIGHTGFTGTGLWVDFDRGLAWTLLTNRVHPTRHRGSGIAQLRRAVGDRIAGVL